MKKPFFIITTLLISASLVFFMKHTKWNNYYRKTLYRAPATTIIEASHLFKNPGSAIDLGCGVGNDTVYLLNNGWQVWAIDADSRAFTWLLSQNNLPKNAPLHTITARFETLDWATLPNVDLVSASLALPFCDPEKFNTVWHHVVSKIKPGGRFAGNFFGVDYKGFSEQEKQQMTFLTKDQVMDLFTDFDIESISELKDVHESKSSTGASIYAHIFAIVARKKIDIKIYL